MTKKHTTYKTLEERRTRNWACIVYPESAPENWQDILSDLHIDCFISPLHDKDKNVTGEPKKPHYHIIVMFSSVKSQAQVKELFVLFGGVGAEYVQSIRAYCRYLCHLDNPEKTLYKPSEVKIIGGLDYEQTCASASDRYITLREIISFIEENDIRYFSELACYASANNEEWFRVLCDSNTLFITQYIKSRTYFYERKNEK